MNNTHYDKPPPEITAVVGEVNMTVANPFCANERLPFVDVPAKSKFKPEPCVIVIVVVLLALYIERVSRAMKTLAGIVTPPVTDTNAALSDAVNVPPVLAMFCVLNAVADVFCNEVSGNVRPVVPFIDSVMMFTRKEC
jgi:hypothetical protein